MGQPGEEATPSGVAPAGPEGLIPAAAAGRSGFAGTTSRGSVNYLIRNTQQQLVALSGQADLKASILITASSVVLTVGVTQVRGSEFRLAFALLAGCLLVSLLAAILCVLPSFGTFRPGPPEAQRAPNPLFFGDYGRIEEADFVDEMGRLSRDDAALYEAQARDLHRQGLYLVTHKYRFLRFGYVMFLVGFAGAAIVVVGVLAT